MGEIRSTLDIIMEKTKGMTLSDDEKREIKEKEISDKVKGLVNRLLDGIINFEKFESELKSFDESEQDLVSEAIKKIVLPLIVPVKDNNIEMRILGVSRDIDLDFIKESIKESEQKLEDEKFKLENELEEAVREKGMSGTAVIPNINAYPGFTQFQSDLKKDFQEKLLTISGDKRLEEDV
jgi:hypothetical protein